MDLKDDDSHHIPYSKGRNGLYIGDTIKVNKINQYVDDWTDNRTQLLSHL